MWQKIFQFILGLFGQSSASAFEAQAAAVVAEAFASWLANLATVGVEDGNRFIVDARELSKQINAKTDADGPEKFALYLAAARQLIVELGGDVAHTLTESVTRTAAEYFHQTDAGVPPDSAHTIGSTNGPTP